MRMSFYNFEQDRPATQDEISRLIFTASEGHPGEAWLQYRLPNGLVIDADSAGFEVELV